jgi:hypothetical protein
MRAGKTTHIFQLGEHSIRFSGNFDSGNLRNVLQLAPFEVSYALQSINWKLRSTHMSSQYQIRLFFTSLWKVAPMDKP